MVANRERNNPAIDKAMFIVDKDEINQAFRSLRVLSWRVRACVCALVARARVYVCARVYECACVCVRARVCMCSRVACVRLCACAGLCVGACVRPCACARLCVCLRDNKKQKQGRKGN